MNRALLALTVSILLPASAAALTPKETRLVDDISLSIPNPFSQEDRTAFVGIDECQRLATRSSKVGATFGTRIDTTSDPDLFEGAVVFWVGRNETGNIDCTEGGGTCRELDESNVDQTPTSIELNLDFEEVDEVFMTAEGCADLDREYFLRVQLRESPDDEEIEVADTRIIIDTIRPVAPTLDSVTVTESLIRVEFSPVAENLDLLRYKVFYSTEPFSQGELPGNIDAESKTFGNPDVTSGEIDVNLTPGDVVYVGISSQDEAGNLSPISAVEQAEAIETTDFWEAYKQAGGAESGGCSQSPASPTPANLFWLVAGGLLLGLRRRFQR